VGQLPLEAGEKRLVLYKLFNSTIQGIAVISRYIPNSPRTWLLTYESVLLVLN